MNIPGLGLLVVSLLSLAVQGTSLLRLLRQPPTATKDQRVANKGLVRTSFTRVFASVLYVAVAINALIHPDETYFSLIIFTIVQVMWQANAFADVKLRKRLSVSRQGRHRKE